MLLKDVIAAKKDITDWGTWKSGKKMPKSAFPMSKQNSFQIRAPYTWRVILFNCGGCSFRLLIAYRIDLSKYSAYLGQIIENDTLIIGRYDYHIDPETAWHFHSNCDGDIFVPGRTGMKNRIPLATSKHRRTAFEVYNETSALAKAIKAFKLSSKEDFSLTQTS